jgi:alcohol dehydrogenase class IV
LKEPYVFQLKSKIVFGLESYRKIGEEVEGLKGRKVLIITDEGVKRAGILDSVAEPLRSKRLEYGVFSEVEENPSVGTVEKAVRVVKENGYDLMIGLGGGSSMDTAKAVGLMAKNPGRISDYWAKRPLNDSIPVIAIPTTAGTGSEVTSVASIKDDERKVKMGIGAPQMTPAVSIVDPVLTLSMPPAITASTGMDALTHAIEAYTNKIVDPISETLSFKAIQLISVSLRTAVAQGDHVEARTNMLYGSMIAGMAFANVKLGAVHAITVPMGGYFPVPHGVINSILLPHVMEFNFIGNLKKFEHVAEAMGEHLTGLNPRQRAFRAIEAVRQLSADIGIPPGLASLGIAEEAIPKICEDAMKNVNIPINPRKPNTEDLVNICRKAM